ncbi:hypothetical protein BS78_10G012700 [Paspalum vaginatum]|nr:hypothetical protein BS78_10G012700 [Paspalum vaginatum]
MRHVRAPDGAPPSSGGGGPVIEMASVPRSERPYAPLSTEDPSASSRGAVTVRLPPAWVDVSKEISAHMQRARTKMAELAKASEKRLQKLSMKDSSEDSNVRKNVHRSLATDLQNLSMEFRKKKSTYLKQLRQQKEDGVDLEMSMNGTQSTFEDDEFEDVVESVNELAQVMKDLSVLMRTIIDQTDYNIQNVAASVKEGYKQLQKAERTQGMVMCATVLVILIFIMIVDSPSDLEEDHFLTYIAISS